MGQPITSTHPLLSGLAKHAQVTAVMCSGGRQSCRSIALVSATRVCPKPSVSDRTARRSSVARHSCHLLSSTNNANQVKWVPSIERLKALHFGQLTLEDALPSGARSLASPPELLVWPLDRQSSIRCAHFVAARLPTAAEFCASMRRVVSQSVSHGTASIAAKDKTKPKNEGTNVRTTHFSYSTVVWARLAWRHQRSHVLLTVQSCRPSLHCCH